MLINGLECSLHEPAEAMGSILMITGFMSTKDSEHRIRRSRAFCDAGFRVLRWTYRDRENKTLSRDLADAISLINTLPEPVFLFGESWGGLVALHAAGHEKVKAIALRSPVVDTNFFANEYTKEPLSQRLREDLKSYDTYKACSALAKPALLLIGARDTVCLPEFARKAFGLISAEKRLVEFDAGHDWPSGEFFENTTAAAMEWFEKRLG
ncbi:MAG: prolyl oligopeptidase family serine peptidase [Candidatus Diapherotrites archaeon]|nr:prolyl oligopeptidase family serine peptidase [Candidatus Diapherotrites archaeon]